MRVPEVVEPEPGESGASGCALKCLGDALGLVGVAVGRDEHKVPFVPGLADPLGDLALACVVAFECGSGCCVDVDRASGPGGLGLGGVELAGHLDERLADDQPLLAKIDATPGESENLSSAEAGQRRQPEERPVGMPIDRREKARQLPGGPDGLFRCARRRRTRW